MLLVPAPFAAAVALVLVGAFVGAQAPTKESAAVPTGFLDKTITIGGREHRYVVYVPLGYAQDSEKAWPLLVFLNGMGECGMDGLKHVEVGLGPAIQLDRGRWPFLVVFPQKPDQQSQWVEHDSLVMGTLAATERDYRVDKARRFLTGLSQGGAGTWALGAKHADVFAAIAPVCGYGKPAEVASALKDKPVWAFHGVDDKAVPVKQSKDLCAAVDAAGGHALLTLYPKVGHNSWDKAYRESDLAEWLLAPAEARSGLWYLSDMERFTRAKVTVRDESCSDGGPPFRATTTVVFECTPAGIVWSVERVHAEPAGMDGPSPEPRRGKLERRESAAFVQERLRPFRDVFALPATVEPKQPAGTVMAWNAYTIDAEFEGSAGPWRFHRVVPRFALHDPRYEAAARALGACVRAIVEMK